MKKIPEISQRELIRSIDKSISKLKLTIEALDKIRTASDDEKHKENFTVNTYFINRKFDNCNNKIMFLENQRKLLDDDPEISMLCEQFQILANKYKSIIENVEYNKEYEYLIEIYRYLCISISYFLESLDHKIPDAQRRNPGKAIDEAKRYAGLTNNDSLIKRFDEILAYIKSYNRKEDDFTKIVQLYYQTLVPSPYSTIFQKDISIKNFNFAFSKVTKDSNNVYYLRKNEEYEFRLIFDVVNYLRDFPDIEINLIETNENGIPLENQNARKDFLPIFKKNPIKKLTLTESENVQTMELRGILSFDFHLDFKPTLHYLLDINFYKQNIKWPYKIKFKDSNLLNFTILEEGIKILFLSANPKDRTYINFEEEIRNIKDGLLKSGNRERFDFEERGSVRVSELTFHLQQHDPTILHISTHCNDKGEIILLDELRGSHTISPKDLSAVLKHFNEHLDCVILSSCYSKSYAETISQHINCVVGTTKVCQKDISDCFTLEFYKSLSEKRNLKKAIEISQSATNLIHKSKEKLKFKFKNEDSEKISFI